MRGELPQARSLLFLTVGSAAMLVVGLYWFVADVAIYRIADYRDHGYWVPLTILFVLKPDPDQTAERIAMRAVGTVVGLIVATALAQLMTEDVIPTTIVLTLAAAAEAYALLAIEVRAVHGRDHDLRRPADRLARLGAARRRRRARPRHRDRDRDRGARVPRLRRGRRGGPRGKPRCAAGYVNRSGSAEAAARPGPAR